MWGFFFLSGEIVTPLLLFNHLFLLFLFINLLWHFFEIGVSFNYNKIGVGTVPECPPGDDKFAALFNTVTSMLYLFNIHF